MRGGNGVRSLTCAARYGICCPIMPGLRARIFFSPPDAIIAFLREVTDAVEHPPAAMTLCTPTDRLLTCRENDRAVDVIRKMNGAGYSHVPLVSEGKLCGVFSAGVIFSYIEANGSGAVTDRTVLSDFGAFLAADAHKTETYRVVGPGESYEGIKKVFVPSGPVNCALRRFS